MARGKLKYRDVVGGGNKQTKKSNRKHVKPRKTYSLYQNDKIKFAHKRKFNNSEEKDIKRQKFEDPKPQVPPQSYSDSESEEEIEDPIQQLRKTFNSNRDKKSLAIDSSSEEEEDDDEKEDLNMEEDGGNNSTSDSEDEVDEAEELTSNKDQALEDIDKTVSHDEEEEEIEPESKEELENEVHTIDDSAEDSFVKHICHDLHENLLQSLQGNPPLVKNSSLNWPKLGRLLVQLPQCDEIVETNNISLGEVKKFAPPGTIPVRIDYKTCKPADLFIKTQIEKHLSKANSSLTHDQEIFTPLQSELFSIVNNYQDLYYSGRTLDNAEEIRFVYCLHIVNHILKTRMKVIRHNARLAKKEDVSEGFRDQGFVRPKILIILPFKDSAYKVIQLIIKILFLDDKLKVMNKKRFIEEYTGNELVMPKRNPKPEDYELTFTGNTSDDFKIGMTVTKSSLKLYADFYSSDIIVASPLGLRRIIGAEGESERDYDFLASIELLVLDQAELFLMQNWDHLNHIFAHLHLQPKDSHGTDFSRIRNWSLNGWAKYYRQTLIFSSLVLGEINGIFNKKCHNYAGKVKVSNPIEIGSIAQVFVQMPHVFHKFQASSVQQAIDARFDFFVRKILPQQRESLMKQTLICVSNYFDYVRLRNYFRREEIGFVQICEYSKEGKIARARDMFYHGDAHFLLYTERYHFFNRIRIKGIRHLVFYQPPNFPNFYSEMCNLMQEGNMNRKIGSSSNMTVSVLYSKYDVQQLAAIVGTERAAKMAQSERSVHMMVTGAD